MLFFRKATKADTETIKRFILQGGISNQGIEANIDQFIIMETEEKEIVGTVGLEVHGDYGLIRSLVMSRNITSEEILIRLLQEAIKAARDKQVKALYLLTKVTPLFQSIGFYPVQYNSVPESILESDHVRQYDKDQITIMEYRF
jgi:amino-acid N-acetyltransferase